MLISHNSPEKPSAHEQVNPLIKLLHPSPLTHKELPFSVSHSSEIHSEMN